MARYGKSVEKTVESAMHRKKRGTLKSGSGKRVTSRQQAIAIGLNEAREERREGSAQIVARELAVAQRPEEVAHAKAREPARSATPSSASGTSHRWPCCRRSRTPAVIPA